MKMHNESASARRQRLIDGRRCIECERKLAADDRGAICSSCYFAIICDPGLADPPRPEPAELAWRVGDLPK